MTTYSLGGESAASATARPVYIRVGAEVRPYRPPSKTRLYAENIRVNVADAGPHGRVEYRRHLGLNLYYMLPAGEELVHHYNFNHRVKDLAFALGMCG